VFFAFRGVAVPEGRHVVEFTYRPPIVLRGLVVSVVSFLMLVLAMFIECKRRKIKPD